MRQDFQGLANSSFRLLDSTAEFIRVGVGSKPGKNFEPGLFADEGGNQPEASIGCASLVHKKDGFRHRLQQDRKIASMDVENRESLFYMSFMFHNVNFSFLAAAEPRHVFSFLLPFCVLNCLFVRK